MNVAGRRLFYADQGDPSAVALLFIHGAAGSHLVWPGPLRRLADTRVLALDLPGHGRSDPPGRRTIAHYVATVFAFIDALALKDVIIVGHSMGSAIGLTAAIEPPAALRGLVVLGAGAQMPVNDQLLGGCLANLDRAAGFIVEYGFAAAPQELRQKVHAAILQTGETTTFGDFLACRAYDIRSRLAGIDVPVLIISGAQDRMTSPRSAEALAAGLPRARLARLEGTGHFSMLEQPDRVARLVAEFVNEHRPSVRGQ